MKTARSTLIPISALLVAREKTMKRMFAPLILAALALAALCSYPTRAQKSSTAPAYTFTDLGGLPALSNGAPYKQSMANAINDAGQIVGSSYTARPDGTNEEHPVVWAKGANGYVITDLGPSAGPNAPTRCTGRTFGINSQGEVTGTASTPTTGDFAFLVRPVSANGPWYQDNGSGLNALMTSLGAGWPPAWSINDSTQIAAGSYLVQFSPTSGAEIVSTVPGGGYAQAINNSGMAAGYSGLQPSLWQLSTDGTVSGPVILPVLPGYSGGSANCINALGQAAGYSGSRATLWKDSATATGLGSLASNSSSDALGISTITKASGTTELQVVGYVDILNRGTKAFLWKNGVMTDLNTLISASGVTLKQASGINSKGQIVGYASVPAGKNNAEVHGFLLTPR